jgi:predicted transposase YbfD/YdcC
LHVKNNQKARKLKILQAVYSNSSKTFVTNDKKHGRIERRSIRVTDVPEDLRIWDGVKQVFAVECIRNYKGKTTKEIHCGITSLSSTEASPEKLLKFWRDHWHIENNLHWVRDVLLREDLSTIRKGSAPRVMVSLRNIVICICKKYFKSMTHMITYCSARSRKAFAAIFEN